jgi:hypothetical protein
MSKPTYEELEAQLDDAWKAYPSWGCVRGFGVQLSEVVGNLVSDRAELKAVCNSQAETISKVKALLA